MEKKAGMSSFVSNILVVGGSLLKNSSEIRGASTLAHSHIHTQFSVK